MCEVFIESEDDAAGSAAAPAVPFSFGQRQTV